MTVNDNSLTIHINNTIVRKQYTRLYNREDEATCNANGTVYFESLAGSVIYSSITLESNLPWMPDKISISVEYPAEDPISTSGVMNFTFVVFMTLWFYCFSMIRQIKRVEDDDNVAKRMSLIFIGWNIIWNFSLFNIYFAYSVMGTKYSQFLAPAFFYFMICFLFELKMLLLCWKANNMRIIQLGVDEARKALITFYVKYYCVCILMVILISSMFYNLTVLFILSGFVWVPQIIKNMQTKARNCPDNKFVISMALSQCFLPLYIRGYPNNQFLTETNYTWSMCFLAVILLQIAILILQKKLGARFMLPEKLRYWNEYNYYRNLDDADEEEGEIECCICLNSLWYIEPETEGQPRETSYHRIIYMQTPCQHKFHIECLKPWLSQKLECPKCRTELPALDEEGY